MKNDGVYSSFWYTRLQGILCLLVFLAWGLGDALSSIYMIDQRGLMQEGNVIVRSIIDNYGVSTFIMFKIWFTLLILFTPFILRQEHAYWMINGYLISFFLGGCLATIINIQAALNEPLLIQPQQVILIYICSILILTNIGEVIDDATHPRIRSFFECGLNDLRSILSYFEASKQVS